MRRIEVEFMWPGTMAGDGRPVRERVYIDAGDHSVDSAIVEARQKASPWAVPTGKVRIFPEAPHD